MKDSTYQKYHVISPNGMLHRYVHAADFNGIRAACGREMTAIRWFTRRPVNVPRCWYCYKGK